jgi:hypothetical protein
MDVLKDALAFLAGYGVRICTLVQGLGQLDDLYGRGGREAILQRSALQVFFAANDESTAPLDVCWRGGISRTLGDALNSLGRSVPVPTPPTRAAGLRQLPQQPACRTCA